MKKAIFLDRDGTLTDDSVYPDFFRENCRLIEDGVGKILKNFKKNGYLLVITTNQAGIDRGLYTKEDFYGFMDELEKQVDLKFDGIYFCPFHPDFTGKRKCRKPDNGMILQAQKDLNIDLKSSYMIGDNSKDVESGNKSGCKTILYNSQNLDVKTCKVDPDFLVSKWNEIEKIILK